MATMAGGLLAAPLAVEAQGDNPLKSVLKTAKAFGLTIPRRSCSGRTR